ncbi:MAG: hypothetical protein QOE92_1858 [Chloroflexota bacterium]|jgi:signal transduction histidine kinase|nr:hypothetical protein [Chloroflexota bacterium]
MMAAISMMGVRATTAARKLAVLAVVAACYWAAARLSLNLALVHGQVTPVWPPTGIALVAMLLLGRRAWVPIAVAALAVNLPLGPSPQGAVAIALGNTLAPAVAAELLRGVGFHRDIDRLRDALAIILVAALLTMTISASVGSGVLVLSGAVPASEFWPTWTVWWAGDAMGVLLVAPFLLSLRRRPSLQDLSLRRGVELFLLIAATGLLSYVLFQNTFRLEYLVLPLVMVVAWRFRLQGAAPAALVASGVAIWSAVEGVGPFATESLLGKMLTLQVFNVSVALASFVLASFVDTRERQEELARLYASARMANEANSSFLNMAAHELRTPISVLVGYLSMMSDGTLGPSPASWGRPLAVLTTKAGELSNIVDALLEASRINARALTPELSVVDLRDVIEGAVTRAHPRAALLGGEIDAHLSPYPVNVEADAAQLGRIMDNLLNNGLSYTRRPPRLSITLSNGHDRAVVRVEDNGIGIPEADRERVFERFHRGSDPALQSMPGTGLGLYISRQLAEAHEGHLVIEGATPDGGTVFALSLPARPATPGAG